MRTMEPKTHAWRYDRHIGWALLIALVSGLILVGINKAGDIPDETTATPIMSAPEACYMELAEWVDLLMATNGDSSVVDQIALTYGIDSDEFTIITETAADYRREAYRSGSQSAAALLAPRIRDWCSTATY